MATQEFVLSDIKQGLILIPRTGDWENLYRITPAALDVNYYRVITRFYRNALWGKMPRTTADPALLDSFRKAANQRSINGFGAVVQSGDVFNAVNTRFLWPIIDDVGARTGWLLGTPYNSPASRNTQGINVPDYIRLFAMVDGADLAQVWDAKYSGSTLGTVTQRDPAQMRIGVFGEGVSDYEEVQWLVAELNKRLQKNSTLLDRHSSPHIQGPEAAAPVSDEEGGERQRPRFQYDEEGMFLPREGEDPEYAYLTWDAKEGLAKLQLDTILDLIHIVTGIPAQVFGLNVSGNSSDTSLERQMFAALSKTEGLRHEVEMAAQAFGDFTFQWTEDPFASYVERAQTEINLAAAGIITPTEARHRLGMDGVAPGIAPAPRTGE